VTSLLPLIGLALVDSTSFGTLILPLALVIRGRGVDGRGFTIYFATVTAFYFLIGVGLLFGVNLLGGWVSDLLSSRPVQWIQLVSGIGLLAFAILKDVPKDAPGRTTKIPTHLSPKAMAGLGFGAALVEAATMVPYLAAMGILGAMEMALGGKLLILLGYCMVMILPALVLIGIAVVLGQKIWPRLERMLNWLERQTAETMLWVAGIVGYYLAANAAVALGLLG